MNEYEKAEEPEPRSRPPALKSNPAGPVAPSTEMSGLEPYVLGAGGLMRLQKLAGNSSVAQLLQDGSPAPDVAGDRGGSPLDGSTRRLMEERLGADFGDVRVYTNPKANDSAKALDAQAYTVGSNVVFQSDHYAPETESGKRTLAHELTHVMQQRAGPVEGTPLADGISVSHPSDAFEQNAEAAAARAVSTEDDKARRTGG